MNEITRIHLGRVPYEIDVSARKTLEKYLADIKKFMGADDEMMGDIEARMTEILSDRGVNRDDVITAADITAIRAQLGEPRDFASDSDSDETEANWHDDPFTGNSSDRKRRRYYRDIDNAMLGGVISGLAAYTGWDVTLLRILAVIFTVIPTWGMLIIVYIIVWAVAPAAKTASEKLEMRGEPVTLDSLKNSDFVKEARDRAEYFADEIKGKASKSKSKSKTAAAETDSNSVQSEFKERASDSKAEAKAFAAEANKSAESESRAEAKSEDGEIREESRTQQQTYRETTRKSVNPIAAIFGVILYVAAFSLMAVALFASVIASVILFQNDFANEIWLWLSGGAAIAAAFTMFGFLIVIANALFKKNENSGVAAAGSLGVCAMLAILATAFSSIWLWSIPRDYELPQPLTDQVRHLDRWDDNEVCHVKVNWNSVEIERSEQCD